MRKIYSHSKVITSKEYLEEIRLKEIKKKQKSARAKKDSEEEEDTTEIYQDESDLEGGTLEDLVNEDKDSTDSDDSMNCDMNNQFNKGDYVLIKFAPKTNVIYFVAHIDVIQEAEVDVSYLQRQGNNFVYPKIVERCAVLKSDIEMKLTPPKLKGCTSRRAN